MHEAVSGATSASGPASRGETVTAAMAAEQQDLAPDEDEQDDAEGDADEDDEDEMDEA